VCGALIVLAVAPAIPARPRMPRRQQPHQLLWQRRSLRDLESRRITERVTHDPLRLFPLQ
jgi:hypothetical protein